MFSFEHSSDHDEYESNCVVVVVKHVVKFPQVMEMLDAAIVAGYREAILEKLGVSASAGTFMVSSDGGRAPVHEHTTKDEALAEATRLAGKEPGTYRVLKLVNVVTSKSKTTIKVDDKSLGYVTIAAPKKSPWRKYYGYGR